MKQQTAADDLDQITLDLREGLELYRVLKRWTPLLVRTVFFQAWTIWDVVAHLHIADHMA